MIKENLYLDILQDILKKRGFFQEEVDKICYEHIVIDRIVIDEYIYVLNLDSTNIPTVIHLEDEYIPMHNLRKSLDRQIKIDEIFEN